MIDRIDPIGDRPLPPAPAEQLPAQSAPPQRRTGGARSRDESLLHLGRSRREARQAKRKRQQTTVTYAVTVGLVALALLGFGVLVWRLATHEGTQQAVAGTARSVVKVFGSASADAKNAAHSIAAPPAQPTPIFAKVRGLDLHLPVPVASLTELGFHQASYDYAQHLTPTMKKADSEKIRVTRTTGGHPVKGTGDDAVLGGYYLRMWRNRPGIPDTAADVGAAPGTPVYAPVSGKIVRVRHYKLYGKIADWEIHIRPDGHPSMDIVMIHVANPTVTTGQHIEAGLTRIAEVRRISNVIDSQLREFTNTGGDHTHIQVNNAYAKDYKGLSVPDSRGLDPYPR